MVARSICSAFALVFLVVWQMVSEVGLGWARALYLNGPAMFGGWEGQDMPDVCGRLTVTAAELWMRNPGECERIIDRKVTAHMIGCSALLFCLVAYQAVNAAWYYVWFRHMIQPNRTLQLAPCGD